MTRAVRSNARLSRREARPVRLLAAAPLRLITALLGLWVVALAAGLRIVVTPSLPRGLYRARSGALAPGDLVMACLPESVAHFARLRGYLWEGSCPGGAVAVGKTVAAVQGDTVTVTAAGVAVNGRSVPNSQARDSDSMGRPLPVLPRGGRVIGSGEIWLSAPYHPLSFDSRYFGPVPTTSVVARLDPLWVW